MAVTHDETEELNERLALELSLLKGLVLKYRTLVDRLEEELGDYVGGDEEDEDVENDREEHREQYRNIGDNDKERGAKDVIDWGNDDDDDVEGDKGKESGGGSVREDGEKKTVYNVKGTKNNYDGKRRKNSTGINSIGEETFGMNGNSGWEEEEDIGGGEGEMEGIVEGSERLNKGRGVIGLSQNDGTHAFNSQIAIVRCSNSVWPRRSHKPLDNFRRSNA